MAPKSTRLGLSVLLLVVAVGCDSSHGKRPDETALDCWRRDRAICRMVNSIGNGPPKPASRELRLPYSEQVELDVAAIESGRQCPRGHSNTDLRRTVP
jgi:hypothetical protein